MRRTKDGPEPSPKPQGGRWRRAAGPGPCGERRGPGAWEAGEGEDVWPRTESGTVATEDRNSSAAFSVLTVAQKEGQGERLK